MPVALTPVLRSKIERRAKRAFRRFDEGDSSRQHRISSITKDSLKYRMPRAGKSLVEVVRRDDGTIVVDPPTTGLVELLNNKDIEKLQNHVGEVAGFIRVLPKKKMLVVGELVASQYFIESRAAVESKIQSDQRVFKVKANASAIEKSETDKVLLNSLEVLAELDLVKDFGFTDGLLDLLTKSDHYKLKKHVGEVRGYMPAKAGVAYQVGSSHLSTSDPIMSREQAIESCKVLGDRVYVVEAAFKELSFGTSESSPFTSSDFKITTELDPEKDLGFTTGLFDCRTKADVEKLRQRKHLGRVRAYKHVTKDLKSPHQTTTALQYEIGKTIEELHAVTDENRDCAAGINLSSPDWCLANKKDSTDRGLAFEFEMKDLAAVPKSSDGKFRVFRALCVEEVDIPGFLPLTPPPPPPAPPAPPPPVDSDPPASAPPSAAPSFKKRGLLDRLLGRGTDDADQS